MVTIRGVTDGELPVARDLHNRFTAQDRSMATVRSWYEEVSSLFLFAVEEDEVIGVSTGRPRGERGVGVAGIGVRSDRRGEGIGTRLVRRFEEAARRIGTDRISVASAGGRVDEFYIDNGFEPEKILVMNPERGPEEYDATDFDIEWDRNEDGSRKCYVTVTGYDPTVLETARDEFNDDHAIYIMAKKLPTR
jgi:GNAT superfamily N-acetyltransferase